MTCEDGELGPVSRTKVKGWVHPLLAAVEWCAPGLPSAPRRCWQPVRGYTPMPSLMLLCTHSRQRTVCMRTSPAWSLHSRGGPSPPSTPHSCHKTSPSVNQCCRGTRPLQPTGSESPSQTSPTQGMHSSLCCGRATPNQAQPAAGRSTSGGGERAGPWLSHHRHHHHCSSVLHHLSGASCRLSCVSTQQCQLLVYCNHLLQLDKKTCLTQTGFSGYS